jgi:putative ABC transport system permease protein
MLKNYFVTALRNISRNKLHSFVKITGLVVGFSAALLILLVLHYEKSFDNFHANKDQLYRVIREGKGVPKEYRTGVPYPVTATLRKDYPQLKNAAAISSFNDVQLIIPGPGGETLKKFKEPGGVFFAEQRFFDMFDFRIIRGNPANAITAPNTAVITRRLADKYFGDWNKAIGRTIKAFGLDIRITGILENPPVNTDLPLGLVISYATMDPDMTNWVNISDNNYCFVQLPAGYAPAQLNALLPKFITKYVPAQYAGYNLVLQPLKEMHFDGRLGNFNGRTFNRDLITALSLIGIFLLVIACVNFINLSTANAVNRSREVGVRKVLGSRRRQLLLQFFGETGVVCLIALAGAVVIALICLPFLNQLLEIDLSLQILLQPANLLLLLSALVAVTLLSGFYPALVLAGFKPINALKEKMMVASGKGIAMRRGLVVFQFVIAQVLIIGTLVVMSQMNYFNKADMGFNQTAIVNAGFPRDSLSRTKTALLYETLSRVPGVKEVSLSMASPSGDGGWATDLRLGSDPNQPADLIVNIKPADTAYFSLYNLQLAAGRVYYPSDTIAEFVVNETLVNKLNLGSPQQAIGRRINVSGKLVPIVGVVKDFHMHSLRDAIDPVVMITNKSNYGLTNIKIAPGKTKTVLAAMEGIWNKLFPDFVFEYSFLDQTIAAYYKQERQLSQLYKIFAGIAIFISCLGLYGLVSFMAVRRRKEIGIRKVLGAPVSRIVWLLSAEFTALIAIAFLVATPIAWFFMHGWLQQYTYRINMGIGFFIVTFLSSILIAWVTVGHAAVSAAVANPVKSLRAE